MSEHLTRSVHLRLSDAMWEAAWLAVLDSADPADRRVGGGLSRWIRAAITERLERTGAQARYDAMMAEEAA